MATTEELSKSIPLENEDEIFKSLGHPIRRNIIKILGDQKTFSFTDIKTSLATIDSPTLSYHLRSMKFLLEQDDNMYCLSEIGHAALLLMDRIDQSARLAKNKRRFVIANIVTICCWTIILIAIPNIVGLSIGLTKYIIIEVLLQVVAQTNFFIIFRLWGSIWKTPKGKRKRKIVKP